MVSILIYVLYFTFKILIKIPILSLGDVDSGDDNESERHSNNSSKSQMNQNTPDVCSKQNFNPISDSHLKYSNNKQSASNDAVHLSNQLNDSHLDMSSNILSTMEDQETSLNCQNISVYGIGNNLVSNQSSDYGNSALKMEESLNVLKNATNESNLGKQAAFDNGNKYNQSYGNERQPFCAGVSPAHGRQLRNRMYGITKPGMVKHETKL